MLTSRQCTSQHLTLPAGLASLHRRTQSMSLYGHSWFNSQRRRVAPPPILSRYVIYLCSGSTRGGRTCLLRSALLESSPLTATKKFYNEPLGEQAKILFYLVLTYISRKESILPKYLYDEVLTLYLMI